MTYCSLEVLHNNTFHAFRKAKPKKSMKLALDTYGHWTHGCCWWWWWI